MMLSGHTSEEFRGRITVYSISGCPHCRRAKAYLTDLNLPYHEIDLDQFPDRRAEMSEMTGRHTVPQIFFNDKHVGGADDLLALDAITLHEFISYVRETLPNESTPAIILMAEDLDTLPSASTNHYIRCEMDKYYELIENARVKLTEPHFPERDHLRGLRNHKATFTGRQLVAWLTQDSVLGLPESEAIVVAKDMMNRLYFIPISSKTTEFLYDDNTLYRLLISRRSKALNVSKLALCDGASPEVTAEQIRRSILKLYEHFLAPDGFSVDYRGIKESDEWPLFLEQTYELQRLNLNTLTNDQKSAFFINIYNVLVIHATIERGSPSSIWKRVKFFSKITYVIGGYEYSLNDIENGILRANNKSPFGWSRPFSSRDPRLPISLTTVDPRIHFALVCGAKSCPPIKTYTASHINEQLDSATRAFLEGGGFQLKRNHIYLSKIFDWYSADFGGSNQAILQWVLPYLSEGIQRHLSESPFSSDQYSLTYLPYDWTSNAQQK